MILIYFTNMVDLRVCEINAQYDVTGYLDIFYKEFILKVMFLICNVIMS